MAIKIKPDPHHTIVFRTYIPNNEPTTIWCATLEEAFQRVFRDGKVLGTVDKEQLNGAADPEFACRLLNHYSFLGQSEKII